MVSYDEEECEGILSDVLIQCVDHSDGWLDLPYLLSALDVGSANGPSTARNGHLANPLNRDESVFYVRDRDQPFTGNEPVFGNFLALDHVGHNPSATLVDFDTVEQLEEHICGPAGITNDFTSKLIAFKQQIVCEYKLTYIDDDGLRVPFDKEREEKLQPFRSYDDADVQLEWITPS